MTDTQPLVLARLPVFALVGRPNVGKSTLFNRLTKTMNALVADIPGLTRDRQFGRGCVGSVPYIVVDTGGLSMRTQGIDELMAQQTERAIEECDHVLFIVDAREGYTHTDQEVAQLLRRTGKPVTLVVNKIDGLNPDNVLIDFYQLGYGEPVPIAASQGRNVQAMIEAVLELYLKPLAATAPQELIPGHENDIRIAVIGRPNVGKSTLINRLIGEERLISFDLPGTTRDSIEVPFERDGQNYVLIDTAGVRRRGKVHETIEKFSVIKAIQAMESAHVVVLVMDAQDDIVEQDVSLLGLVIDAGRSIIIAINKWDGLDPEKRERIKSELDRRLSFIDYAEIHYISALHGSGVGHLLDAVQQAYRGATVDIKTSKLTEWLEQALIAHQPPLVRGRRIKLRYAHQGGRNPPLIIIHGNQTDHVPESFSRYLMKYFRKRLRLVGTPIRIEYRGSENPYRDKRNPITPKQQKQRQRMMRHIKRGK